MLKKIKSNISVTIDFYGGHDSLMPSRAGFLKPMKSRLGPSKSTFNAKNFICSFPMFYCLSQLVSVQFTLSMCLAVRNRQNIHKTAYFGVQGHWIGHHGNEIWDKMGDNSAPLKENCTLFAPTLLFSGPRYPMVSFKFFPCQPLLPWQRILGQNSL